MKPVGDDGVICCEICETWYHSKCTGMQEQMFKALCQYGREVHWFCRGCNAGADKLFAVVSRIGNKVDKLESEMARMKSEQHSELTLAVKEIRDDLVKLGQRIKRCERKVDDSKQELHTSMMSKFGEIENKVEDCNKRDGPCIYRYFVFRTTYGIRNTKYEKWYMKPFFVNCKLHKNRK